MVVNADDYYGREVVALVHDFLVKPQPAGPEALCMESVNLKNTLLDNGNVTCGICQVREGYLTSLTLPMPGALRRSLVKKTYHIAKQVGEDGTVTAWSGPDEVNVDSLFSMNMWGLTSGMMDLLEYGFRRFFADMAVAPNRAERELEAE